MTFARWRGEKLTKLAGSKAGEGGVIGVKAKRLGSERNAWVGVFDGDSEACALDGQQREKGKLRDGGGGTHLVVIDQHADVQITGMTKAARLDPDANLSLDLSHTVSGERRRNSGLRAARSRSDGGDGMRGRAARCGCGGSGARGRTLLSANELAHAASTTCAVQQAGGLDLGPCGRARSA
ncbi:hypothetical protein FGB62_168g00 [Gracilaria domingensis]|nr:hypothetical protein FGB62_168g00 [Gracilaria domingensis]